MNRKNIIGIPIKNLEEPMSRLASTLDKNQRITLQIGLIKNLAECFRGKDNDIFLISNNLEIEKLANQLEINFFKTNLINWNTNLKFDCIIFRGSFQFLGKDLNNHMEKISNICSNKSKIIVYSLPNSDSILYHILKDKWHLFDRFSHTLIFNRNSIMYLAKKFDYNVVECSYPYLETPYANITKDYEKLKKLIKFGKNESFPFWGNIMQVVLEKNT